MVIRKKRLARWRETAARILAQHHDWNATQIRRELAVVFGEDKVPGLSAVQKELQKLRPRLEKIARSDGPWHLGLLPAHPEVSADAVPYILMVQQWAMTRRDQSGKTRRPLSILQALWIARLYRTVDLSRVRAEDLPEATRQASEYLWDWSAAYEERQTMVELIANHTSNLDQLVTSDLDQLLMEGASPLGMGYTNVTSYKDRLFDVVFRIVGWKTYTPEQIAAKEEQARSLGVQTDNGTE